MAPPSLAFRRAVVAVAVAAAMAISSSAAAADDAAGADKLTCVRAAERAQKSRVAGRLVEARQDLAVCARELCPGVVRVDCRQWLLEVDAGVPSVVVAAKTGDGADLGDVRVRVDGAVVADRLSGNPIPINPGNHDIDYESASGQRVREHVIIRAGEKNRVLTVTFGAPSLPKPMPPFAAPPPANAAAAHFGIAPVALFSVSAIALGSFAYFGISGRSDADHLRSTCSPRCAPSDVSDVRTRLLVADVSLGAAIAAAAVATAFVFIVPAKAAPAIRVEAIAGGASAGLSGHFP